jgi:hypothetical protein
MKQSLIILALFLLYSCASVQSLSGGEKDLLPPKVIQTSIDSASVLVSTPTITFTFDEYINLNNAKDLLLISPNQTKQPTLTKRGKKLVITLNDSLIPNTTYTYNFNGAVTDLNEGNKLENYSFIYSTGSYIDSLKLQGYVKDITTNEACTDCYVLLYSSESTDSCIFNKKPYYLAKTDELGHYAIANLPNSSFKKIAIRDVNKNLTLDHNEYVSLSTHSSTNNGLSDTLIVFPANLNAAYNPTLINTKIPGFISIKTAKPITRKNTIFLINQKNTTYEISYSQDTLFHYFIPTTDTTLVTLITPSDTTNLYYILSLADLKYNLTLNYENTDNKIVIKSKTQIESVNSSLIKIYSDSIPILLDSISRLEASFCINLPANSTPSSITLQENTIIDVFGKGNKEVKKELSTPLNNNTNLTLEIKIDSGAYILELFKDKKIYNYNNINSSKKLIINNLEATTYSCRLIKDLNNNGRWDTGDYFLKISPEPIQFTAPFEIRENWDKELIINAL